MSWRQKRRVAKRRSRGRNGNHSMTLEFSFIVHFNPISNKVTDFIVKMSLHHVVLLIGAHHKEITHEATKKEV
jgi:hypothetical protein